MALPITGSQTQTTTQSPQGGASAQIGGAPTATVQPTTSSSVQSNSASILQNNAGGLKIQLPPPSPKGTVASTASSSPAKHHTNPVFFGLALGLFVLAVVLFWLAGRAERSKTYK